MLLSIVCLQFTAPSSSENSWECVSSVWGKKIEIGCNQLYLLQIRKGWRELQQEERVDLFVLGMPNQGFAVDQIQASKNYHLRGPDNAISWEGKFPFLCGRIVLVECKISRGRALLPWPWTTWPGKSGKKSTVIIVPLMASFKNFLWYCLMPHK